MVADDFPAFCAELLAIAGPVSRRRMFGGHGFYVDGLFVAILESDRLYLKADSASAPRFEAAGGERFTYASQGREAALSYWTPPAEAMESAALMAPWVRLALQAALSARAARAASGSRKAKAGPAAARKRPRPTPR